MSWKQPQYGVRGRELNWLQGTLQNHDCFCGCDNPVKHLIETALKHGGVYDFSVKTLKELLKCHDFTDDHHGNAIPEKDGGSDDDTPPDVGDLERLFAQDSDFTEEDAG